MCEKIIFMFEIFITFYIPECIYNSHRFVILKTNTFIHNIHHNFFS